MGTGIGLAFTKFVIGKHHAWYVKSWRRVAAFFFYCSLCLGARWFLKPEVLIPESQECGCRIGCRGAGREISLPSPAGRRDSMNLLNLAAVLYPVFKVLKAQSNRQALEVLTNRNSGHPATWWCHRMNGLGWQLKIKTDIEYSIFLSSCWRLKTTLTEAKVEGRFWVWADVCISKSRSPSASDSETDWKLAEVALDAFHKWWPDCQSNSGASPVDRRIFVPWKDCEH